MPAPIIPWQPSNFPVEITRELDRRKINRSFNFKNNTTSTWGKDGNFNDYRGPMVSWIRVCSNSAGHPLEKKERFVLYSGKGFYDTYGFSPPKNPGGAKQQIIGYTPGDKGGNNIQSHVIENSLISPSGEVGNYPINVPSPEISRLEVTVQKELLRRVQLEWVCFSWKQLQYMTPYFLVPGITCMVEWGWNHYNIKSLVNLGDIGTMRDLWDNAYPLYTDNILKSDGNYDVVYGIITNFNFSMEGNKIICTTEITSKDRLYAGIAKDYGLSVNDKIGNNIENGIVQSIRDFVKKDNILLNLKNIVAPTEVANSSSSTSKTATTNSILNSILKTPDINPVSNTWRDILKPLLTTGNSEQKDMQLSYVFGIFAGRPTDAYISKENFGTTKNGDFDKNTQTNDPNNFWINMGLVVAILNNFSKNPSGTGGNNTMFKVDIQNSVISGHPNLISCDSRVLIPNYQAPKFLYGSVGTTNNMALKGISSDAMDKTEPYSYQVLRPIDTPLIVNNKDGTVTPNQQVSKIFYQQGKCYRDNLDMIINYNRYRYATTDIDGLDSYSFPAQFDSLLPESQNNLAQNKLEKDYSGLLSNLYISFGAFKDAVENEANASYLDIYKSILQILMDASDGFWDLSLVEAGDGVMTITDKKFIGKYSLDKQGDVVYSFDYFDADSIIKSLKFRPVMSDAQATRVIYGSVNNKDSKYQYVDKNDLLDYIFRDAVIGTKENKTQNNIHDDTSAREQYRDLLKIFQNINSKNDDGTLQMSLNSYRQGLSTPSKYTKDIPEYVKLVMGGEGGQQLLRLLLNDNDYDNNPRYCAVQPGIILELTLQGIGGLRTFQYFLIKNLPEPYSDRNVIFRITDVHQTIESGNWETTIRAQLHPLRGYIKNRLKGPFGSSAGNNGWPPDPKL